MKLFLTTNGDSLSDKIDTSFGRCNYFLVYETEDDSFVFIKNKYQDAQTSVGEAVANTAIELNANVVISFNPGPKAFKVLQDAGITIYHIIENTKIKSALLSFAKNELVPLETYMPYQS